MFDKAISSAFKILAAPLSEAAPDVPLDFDWRGEARPSSQTISSRPLTAQVSVSDPLFNWSSTVSPARQNRTSTPSSTITYSSDNRRNRVTTPSGYSCVSDPSSGVHFEPIIPPAPTIHAPVARAPASLEFQRPLNPPVTPAARSDLTSSTPYATPKSTFSSSTTSTRPSFSPIVTSPATPIAPPVYKHSGPSSSILGQSNGLLPTWDTARPLFRPETPPGLEPLPQTPNPRPDLHSTQKQKRKASPAPDRSSPKRQRRYTKDVEEAESSPEDDAYEGIRLRDTGYQSVGGSSTKSKAKPSPTIKGKGKKSPTKRRITSEDEDEEHTDSDVIVQEPVTVKKEPVKEVPVKQKGRAKPPVKRVPFGTKWSGPRGGPLKLNSKAHRPDAWVDGLYRWSYSVAAPVSAETSDRMPGDVHFCPNTDKYAEEDEPFTSWVVTAGSTGRRWVEFAAGQPHPEYKGWVFQEAKLPKTPPRWVKEATFKAKY
ncbi:hypothetical protein FRC09_016105 [Ceratobasidium sp. 395]|nr:hypothetical protein FRC09_016105 [Ceratobasidium sp. 395]